MSAQQPPAADKQLSELEVKLENVRKDIREAKNYGYDSIEFQMPYLKVLKYKVIFMVVLFAVIGFYEELTCKNTAFKLAESFMACHFKYHIINP